MGKSKEKMQKQQMAEQDICPAPAGGICTFFVVR